MMTSAELDAFGTVLELLRMRGCELTMRNVSEKMQVWNCYYDAKVRCGVPSRRMRMFYTDARGIQQALGLLEELNKETKAV